MDVPTDHVVETTDEAQNIKNRNTKAAKAAVALEAKYRWCLTGYVSATIGEN